jgi:hypothetical protein
MKWFNRTVELKLLLILIMGILTYDIASAFVISLQASSRSEIGPAQLKLLFLPIICSIGLSLLWTSCKYEYMLLLSGQILILGPLSHEFSFPNKTLIVIQTFGAILFSIATVRITTFLISRGSNAFIENLLIKKTKNSQSNKTGDYPTE